ncbi:DUF2147 domain-containing protein [Sphingomonas oligophenolica]|uniref:DUF2147 domain-containing protein n=1 Tax=Sphingomonas oligophenolica TaxID=301154 RepID=A0ABU9Y4J4_9SPHN
MRRQAFILVAVAAMTSPSLAWAADPSFGIWTNPKSSVHVRSERCGERMCGVVVWASEKAKADARKGSAGPLIGSRLFQDFTLETPGVWRGKVFVPDIGKTFSGTIRVIDNDTIVGSGCLIGRMGCKSQQWTRLKN